MPVTSPQASFQKAPPIRPVWRATTARSITRTRPSRRPARAATWSIRARLRLASTGDAACTQCHADLKTTHGASKFAANITGFNGSHPEFAALRPGATDPGTIKFNHQRASERRSARSERPGAVEVRRLPPAAARTIDSVHAAGRLREALRRLPPAAVRPALQRIGAAQRAEDRLRFCARQARPHTSPRTRRRFR